MYEKFIQLIQKARSHEGFLRYAKNTSWLMGEKILRMFIGLFVGIWVARYLGPEQFGLLSYAQSFVFLFTAIATLGLDSIVVRELVKNGSQRDIILGTAFTLKLIGAIGILPILWIAVQFTSNDSYTNLLIFITASATIFQSFNVIDFYYQSTVMSKYVALSNTISLLLSSVIKIILILNHASLTAFAWMSVFDAVVVMAGFLYFYITKTEYRLGNWRFDKQKAKALLQSSYPLMIAGAMFVTYTKIDQIIIHHYLDDVQVGYFAASLKLVEPLYFIPVTLVSSLMPAIINAKATSTELYQQRMRFLIHSCLCGAWVICIFVSLSSHFLVTILYGENFYATSQILAWQIWLLLFTCMGYINGAWFINEQLEKYVMYNYTMAALLNILLNIFLIPKYGVMGAVYASLISQFSVYYILLWLNRKTRYLVKNLYLGW